MADKSKAPKLLLDEQIWKRLASLMREKGFDVVHVYEAGLDHTDDGIVLSAAVEKHRAVVTFNIKHFMPFITQYFDDGKEHYGIVVSDEVSRGELQRRVTKLLESITEEELKNTVRYLQEFK